MKTICLADRVIVTGSMMFLKYSSVIACRFIV